MYYTAIYGHRYFLKAFEGGSAKAAFNMANACLQQEVVDPDRDRMKMIPNFASELHVATKPPHIQAALYWYDIAGRMGLQRGWLNCGLILAGNQGIQTSNQDKSSHSSSEDLIHALRYLQATYRLDPSSEIATAAASAHQTISEVIAFHDLSSDKLIAVFTYGTLSNHSNTNTAHLLRLWTNAIGHITTFNASFVRARGSIDDRIRGHLLDATVELRNIVDSHDGEISDLQRHLALDNLQDMLGPLAGKDDTYVTFAALYAEKMALSKYCYNNFAR
jgi:hypothetical protein